MRRSVACDNPARTNRFPIHCTLWIPRARINHIKPLTTDVSMFHYDRGLRITSIDLGVDMRRRQPRGFISHAHTDHMARHELAYCTPATAELYQHRYGPRPTHSMRFGEPLVLGDCVL